VYFGFIYVIIVKQLTHALSTVILASFHIEREFQEIANFDSSRFPYKTGLSRIRRE
jgi:hypothetical protein